MPRFPVRPSAALAILALGLFTAQGCVEMKSGSSPTSPSPGVSTTPAPGTGTGTSGGLSIQAFSGSWASGSAGGTTLPTTCTAFDYRVTPSTDGRSGTVAFTATCAGIAVDGTGAGTLNGEVLSWSAQGTASRVGLTCPFTFSEGTAALENGGVRLTYRGTVCGFPVSGSELLRKV